MNRRILFALVSTAYVLGHVQSSYSQITLFRDDFEQGYSDDWRGPWSTGIFEVDKGVLSITHEEQYTAMFTDEMPDDVTIRTSVQLLGEPSDEVWVGIGARSPFGGPRYSAGVSSGGQIAISANVLNLWQVKPVELRPQRDEIQLEFDLSGSDIVLTVSDTNSSDTLTWTVEDLDISGEGVGLFYAPGGDQNATTVIFEYFEIIGHSSCNLNRELVCDIADVDALVASGDLSTGYDAPTVGKGVRFDLNDDGLVNSQDIDTWLANAAAENGTSKSYLLGDSDLDGIVGSRDLNTLALNWNNDAEKWSDGDFNGDGKVGSADLNLLALNWQAASAAPVPESQNGWPVALILSVFCLRKRFK